MFDMNNIEACIVRYLHGEELTEDELRRLDVWLQESPENGKELIRLKAVHDLTRNHSHSRMSGEETERSWQKLMRKMTAGTTHPSAAPDEPGRKMIRLNTVLRYASAVAVAVMISFGAGDYFGRRSRPAAEIRPAVYSEVSVPKGGKPNTVYLSDGSVVRLNAATTLRYPSGFDGDRREIYLDGEAYFEVAKNEAKPFVVRLKQQEITVLGTSFNVEARHSESYTIVTLQEGSVSLTFMNSNGLKIKDVALKPDQKAHFDRTTGKVFVAQVDASLSNTWLEGEYKFKDEPLVLIFKRLENYYDVNIHLDGEQLKNIRYTGTFSIRQDIRDVLRIINHERQFRFRQDGSEIYIKSK
jgi:ferric-dicitrate binding protein FerR (iron transport regulator)